MGTTEDPGWLKSRFARHSAARNAGPIVVS